MENKELAPIVLFVYNRLEHTKLAVEALLKNELACKSEIYIFSDGAKNELSKKSVNDVREYIKTISGFEKVNIIERKLNFGLAKSIIDGVTQIIKEFGKVIVLEDDIIVTSNFLKYMNGALEFYKNNDKLWSIAGYGYPIDEIINGNEKYYLYIRSSSWGWGTWERCWSGIDWEISSFNTIKKNKKLQKSFNLGGEDLYHMLKMQMQSEIDSWAIRWSYAAFQADKYTLYPRESFVVNIGFDGSGEHCRQNDKFNGYGYNIFSIMDFPIDIVENEKISSAIRLFLKLDVKHKIWYIVSDFLDIIKLSKLKLFIKKCILK